ncbi:MAG: hypothetical protein QW596_04685 [Sulfolobales archaeon]
MKIKCFEFTKVGVPGVRFTALNLVREVILNEEVSIDDIDLDKLIDELELNDCDCVLLTSCSGSQCVEKFEYVKKLESFKTLISSRPEKLLGLSILVRPSNNKEVDVFYGSQVGIKHNEVPDGKYVFEGELSTDECSNCLGFLLRTESGIRVILNDEGVRVRKPGKHVRRKRKKKKVRKKSKKKR